MAQHWNPVYRCSSSQPTGGSGFDASQRPPVFQFGSGLPNSSLSNAKQFYQGHGNMMGESSGVGNTENLFYQGSGIGQQPNLFAQHNMNYAPPNNTMGEHMHNLGKQSSNYGEKNNPVPVDDVHVVTSSVKAGNGGKSRKLPNFNVEEDKVLVSCWLNVSTDPIVGTSQRRPSFWRSVYAEYNKIKPAGYPHRSLRSIENRWAFINSQVGGFRGHYNTILRANWSGFTYNDKVAAAISLFNSQGTRPFAMIHCWEILKDQAKWLDIQDLKEKASGTEENDPWDLNEDQASADVSNSVEQPKSSGYKRPMGRDAAKTMAKKSNSASNSESSEDVVSKMSDLAMKKIELYQKECSETENMFEKLMEIEKKKIILEEQKMEMHQKKMEMHAKNLNLKENRGVMEQQNSDLAVMSIDLSTCDPEQRIVYAAMRAQIVSRWAKQGLV